MQLELPPDMQAEISTEMAQWTAQAVTTAPASTDAAGAAPADASAAAEGANVATEDAASTTPAEEPKDKPAAKAKADTEEASPVEDGKPEEQTPTEIGRLALKLQKRERAIAAREAQFQARQREFQSRASQLEKIQAQLEAESKAVGDDPLSWLEKRFGLSRDDIAHRLLNDGKPRPEEGMTGTKRELEELRTKLKALEDQRMRENTEAVRERELARFVGEARADADRWPLASKYSEAKLRAKGLEIASTSRGPITNADILDRIEEELSEIASLRGGAQAPVATRAPSVAQPPARKAVAPMRRAEPAPTLAGAVGDGAGNADDEVDFIGMDPEEQRKLLQRTLRTVTNRSVPRN